MGIGSSTPPSQLCQPQRLARKPSSASVNPATAATTTPPQRPLNGVTKLTVELPAAVGSTRIALLFSPASEAASPALTALDTWR